MQGTMLSRSVVALSAFGYLLLLFAIASYGDWRRARGRSVIANPYIYTLSLALYCTSWTFYGSVGKAATDGISFLSIYLGPTIMASFWWFILRKLLRICKENNLTTRSDFLTLRFGKGPFLGGLVTVGMVLAVAFESVVKLMAFLAIGILVTYGLFSGWGEIFTRICRAPEFCQLPRIGTRPDSSYALILVQTALAMGAIVLLPRQFHMAVVENTDEKHILTAIWLPPLYLLLINLFVMPIAFGGLLSGLPVAQADAFVLRLPLQNGHPLLALLAFLGGLSASTAMVTVASLALSTMLLNSLVMPVAIRLKLEERLPKYLLAFKRAGILAVILLGYLSYRLLGPHTMLVDMGLIAFRSKRAGDSYNLSTRPKPCAWRPWTCGVASPTATP
jgi:Na+/proline symporter